MLSSRQIQELVDYSKSRGEFLSSAEVARRHGISQRTLRNDLIAICNHISDHGAVLESVPSKGTRLVVVRQVAFQKELQSLLGGSGNSSNDRPARIVHILRRLTNTKGYIPIQRLANEMFVARSTLAADLKSTREIVERYGLAIETKIHQGIRLVGDEANIRQCIIKENVNIPIDALAFAQNTEHLSLEYQTLSRILTEQLIKHRITVSDYVFQTIIVHLEISLNRMNNGYCVQDNQDLDHTYSHPLEVAREIIRECCRTYRLGYHEGEAVLLAINLQGKRELEGQEYVSEEISRFIFQTLGKIRNQFRVDLTNDMNLRISLALHTLPLITRAENGMQLENSITFDIKQKFVLAFDVASFYAQELWHEFGIQLTDDEISFLALHFSVSLERHSHIEDPKRVLVISSDRKSTTILIQQKLKQWFPNMIEAIDIINARQIDTVDFDKYDAVLTPDKSLAKKTGAIPIDFFLSDDEYNKVKLAISGFSKPEDLMDVFDRDMFYVGPIASKEEAFRIVTDNAQRVFPQDTSIYDAICAHEAFTNSYMGNLVAMPHPNNPITDRTFISVAVATNEVDWGIHSGAGVRLIMLVCVERDNPAAYSIWHCLSTLVADAANVERLMKNPTYETLLDVVHDSYC